MHDLGAGNQDIPAFHGGAVVGDVGGLIHLGHLAYRCWIGILLGAVGVAEAAAVLVAGAVTGEGAGKQLAEAGVVARAGARGIVFAPLVLLGGVGILVGVAEAAGLARTMACIRIRRGIGGRVFAVGQQAVHLIFRRRADAP